MSDLAKLFRGDKEVAVLQENGKWDSDDSVFAKYLNLAYPLDSSPSLGQPGRVCALDASKAMNLKVVFPKIKKDKEDQNLVY